MFAPRNLSHRPTRRGAILLVVLTLLALFAVVGLSIALYAEAEATASRIKREATDDPDPFADPGEAVKPYVNEFLAQLIYDVSDTGQPATSALRGHSMARLMYGANPTAPNVTPYNGIGTFFETVNISNTQTMDRRQIVRFSYYDRFTRVIDPEHTGFRDPNQISTNPAGTFVGKNAPYTYPDRNNIAVAVIDPTTGNVILPSFHRPNLFNPNRSRPESWLAPPRVDRNGQLTNLPNDDGVNPPTNSEWLTADPANGYKLLRPRPEDHRFDSGDGRNAVTDFPYPPMNADGTYTGDVQNWRWTDGQQRNDSVWLMCNMPVFTYKGKKVTALVAPLVIPLDGRINATVAGNLKGTGNTHASNQGFGPWEINLTPVLQGPNASTEAQRLIAWRYGNDQLPAAPGSPSSTHQPTSVTTQMPSLRGTGIPGHTAKVFAGMSSAPVYPQDYARIDWDAAGPGAGGRFPYPTGTQSDPPFSGWPPPPTTQYGNGYYTAPNTGEGAYHPSLFNPYTWGGNSATGEGRTLPFADLRTHLTRYSYAPDTFDRGLPGSLAPDNMAGSWGDADLGPGTRMGRVTRPGDPTNPVRSLLTPISNSLKRPTWAPNFPSYQTGAAYEVAAPGMGGTYLPPRDIRTGAAAQFTLPPPVPTGEPTDFVSATSARSLVASLGALDLNRKLADYRGPTPAGPLNPTVVQFNSNQNFVAAWADRQILAQEVFARLVFVTGAFHASAYNPSTRTFSFTGASAERLNALRWLAQLAVNIVDYRDEDDVSTPFIWNPVAPIDPTRWMAPATAPNIDPMTNAAVTNNFSSANIGNSVVFGVEKPRLLLNESYAEVVNDPSDTAATMGTGPAMNDFHARFWFELLNPGNIESNATGTLGDGEVRLYYAAGEAPTAFSPYSMRVFNAMQGAIAVQNLTAHPENVTGATSSTELASLGMTSATPQCEFDFSSLSGPGAAAMRRVTANNSAPKATAQNQGFAVVGAATSTAETWQTFRPDQNSLIPMPPPGVNVIAIPDGGMMSASKLYYTVAQQTEMNMPMALTEASNGVVLLRRLACPYLPPGVTNPYITVDVMTGMVAQDAVRRATDSMAMDRTPMRPPMSGGSRGRRQPLYGPAHPMVNQVTVNPANSYAVPGLTETFFAHNDARDANFDWFVHMDRRLINPLELVHVSAVPAHALTTKFNDPTAPAGQQQHRHTAGWFDRYEQTMGGPALQPTLLWRALEALSVKPWTHGVPDGGRTPGRINVNMVWDPKVLQALLDPQPVNFFSAAEVYSPSEALNAPTPTTLWVKLFAGAGVSSRTKAFPNVSTTLDEGGTLTAGDRPFKGLGVASYAAGGALPAGSGLDDTLFRRPVDTTTGQPTSILPVFTTAAGGTHPHQQLEPLRKVMNNVTTVSDTYLVLMTVGIFEVRSDDADNGANGIRRIVLGKEVFKDTPGDLRVQYAAIVDRTGLGVLDPTTATSDQPADPLWFAELAESAGSGSTTIYVHAHRDSNNSIGIFSDGQFIPLNNGTQLRLGFGHSANSTGDGETVTVSSTAMNPVTFNAGDNTPTAGIAAGVAAVPITATTRPHASGSPVSNGIPGNPGPRSDFDVFNAPGKAKYKGVVPYVTKVTP